MVAMVERRLPLSPAFTTRRVSEGSEMGRGSGEAVEGWFGRGGWAYR